MTIKPVINTASLSDDITHALHRSWFFKPDDVHIRSDGGKIVLTGTVKSFHERQVVAEVA